MHALWLRLWSCVLFVIHRCFPIVGERAVAAGGAAASCRGLLEADWDVPGAEGKSFAAHHLLPVARVGLVTQPARASLALVGHVDHVQVATAVAESRVERRVLEAQEVLLVALQAEVVGSFLIR